jgi:hypothetical protein
MIALAFDLAVSAALVIVGLLLLGKSIRVDADCPTVLGTLLFIVGGTMCFIGVMTLGETFAAAFAARSFLALLMVLYFALAFCEAVRSGRGVSSLPNGGLKALWTARHELPGLRWNGYWRALGLPLALLVFVTCSVALVLFQIVFFVALSPVLVLHLSTETTGYPAYRGPFYTWISRRHPLSRLGHDDVDC